MRSIDDSALLTPRQRLHELSSIVAAGLLRICTLAALSGEDSGLARQEGDSPIFVAQKLGQSPNSGKPGLDVSGKTVLSFHSG